MTLKQVIARSCINLLTEMFSIFLSQRSHRPTVHTMPTSFHAKSQKFSEHLGQCGMYKNQSLNTSMDKSIV